MLVVVGSRHDSGACEIVQQWERDGAALLTCEDLSAPGWRYSPSDPTASRTVIGGQVIRQTDVRGVLVRRPRVLQQELTHIAPADREFVAAEMSAFLLAWLSHLPCRVLNRPRGASLCGPDWRPLQWALAAARVGLQVEPRRWHAPSGGKTDIQNAIERKLPPTAALVVGDRCVGNIGPKEAAGAKRLASAAGVALLAVCFAKAEHAWFLAANPMPSLKGARAMDAVRMYLLAN